MRGPHPGKKIGRRRAVIGKGLADLADEGIKAGMKYYVQHGQREIGFYTLAVRVVRGLGSDQVSGSSGKAWVTFNWRKAKKAGE
jgi:hypothetical protein